jgi:hypothetical protein
MSCGEGSNKDVLPFFLVKEETYGRGNTCMNGVKAPISHIVLSPCLHIIQLLQIMTMKL